ncbi:40S ribosomal protein S27 [Saxophila tyrrhenica]|uniref:40S ribosomal protein S27 n=1 Tax=Saxophila tyrrhenica TaxID=1690608 RepID=A0AAV9P0H6_9PEZI|nr:40S ribosomal protein S27 [Saxophila tyrrhenica]
MNEAVASRIPREHTTFEVEALRVGVGIAATYNLSGYHNGGYEDRARLTIGQQVLAVDLLNPTPQAEARKHKLKTLVPGPRSFFMDVKCPGCFTITTVFSHAQTVVVCAGCSQVLCQPTGGKARLTEGCSFRRK